MSPKIPPGTAVTRGDAIRLAGPIVLANAVEPLAGIADTAVIGAAADQVALGGIALGVTVVNVVSFTFYFLRMSTTGLAAQAEGAGDVAESQRILLRGLGLAVVLGLLALAASGLVAGVGFALLAGTPEVELAGRSYFFLRALGFPGAFALFALTGWMIALGRTRQVLIQQVVFSGTNVILDLVFVLAFELGVEGVAAATTIAHWTAAGVGSLQVRGIIGRTGWAPAVWDRARLLDPAGLRRLLALNSNFVLRTWAMLISFSWFAHAGARAGTAQLAANHVLLQIITFWAFTLDAFAFVAESMVGRAVGAGSRSDFVRAVRITAELSLGFGAAFAALTALGGPSLIAAWVRDEAVQSAALAALPYCALVPLLGAPAWQLDGVFVGAMRSRAMRNAAVASSGLYIATDLVLHPHFGTVGMWPAFLCYYLYRAGTLVVVYPRIIPVKAG